MPYRSVGIILVLFVTLGLVVFSYPATAACVFSDEKDMSDTQLDNVEKARARIHTKFGPLKSEPVVTFFNDVKAYWPLNINSYGSASFLGYKTCVLVGPDGQNVDVVAHELMHAEIASRAGHMPRIRKLPTWFDEGLAMQVDYRELIIKHYAASKAIVALWLSRVDDVYRQLDKLKEGASFESIWLAVE